jgi:hypothetical protein
MRARRTATIPRHVVLTLGLGAGINSIPDEELRALWLEWGEAVNDYYLATFGKEAFVKKIAEDSGWTEGAK